MYGVVSFCNCMQYNMIMYVGKLNLITFKHCPFPLKNERYKIYWEKGPTPPSLFGFSDIFFMHSNNKNRILSNVYPKIAYKRSITQVILFVWYIERAPHASVHRNSYLVEDRIMKKNKALAYPKIRKIDQA